MNSKPNTITRRELLRCTLEGAVAVSLISPAIAPGAPADLTLEPVFLPENDYPFFGDELPEAYTEKS